MWFLKFWAGGSSKKKNENDCLRSWDARLCSHMDGKWWALAWDACVLDPDTFVYQLRGPGQRPWWCGSPLKWVNNSCFIMWLNSRSLPASPHPRFPSPGPQTAGPQPHGHLNLSMRWCLVCFWTFKWKSDLYAEAAGKCFILIRALYSLANYSSPH